MIAAYRALVQAEQVLVAASGHIVGVAPANDGHGEAVTGLVVSCLHADRPTYR